MQDVSSEGGPGGVGGGGVCGDLWGGGVEVEGGGVLGWLGVFANFSAYQ